VSDAPAERIAPPAFLARGAPAAILAALPGARAVGGCVRDTLAGRAVHDVDIAAPLPPEEIAARLGAAGLKVFETGLRHGTVTAVLDQEPVEVTALRRDVATDGRHAEVAWTTDWREDAERRDFTFNAMSCDAAGALWDYFGGRADLAAGRVRFVGDPATRLAEDYLRALRFFRFWARYGRGDPDAAALAAIRDAIPGLLARIAPERIWMELKRLLEAPDPMPAIALMERIGLWRAVLPESDELDTLAKLVAIGAPADPLLRLAAILDEAALPALALRLRWSGAERARLAALVAPGMAEDVRVAVAESTRETVLDRLWLAEARDGRDRAPARAAVAAMAAPAFALAGRDLLAMGLPPGPAVGGMLAAMRRWWIEGGAVADRAALLAEARKRLGAADGTTAPSGTQETRGT
jgi:poly(A) polymerase/tRNA nucleotidyltransferase (CCA-adding enzyme)